VRRLPLLLVVLLAGCGSSTQTRIDAHNAKQLQLSRVSAGALGGVRHATVRNGLLELVAPSGSWKVSAGARSVRLLDARTGATLDALVSQIASPTVIAWTRDGKAFAVGGKDGRITVWEEFKHRTYDLPAGKSQVTALAFSSKERLLASAQSDGGIRIWDLAKRKEVARLGPAGVIHKLLFSGDGQELFAGDRWQLRLPR
jgi:WD40 repeat protein